MSKLFDNAVQSIKLGLEDYEANDPTRTLSAIRNFYAGLLLLSKEVLVRAVPGADEWDVIAANYKPKRNRAGVIKYVPRGKVSIDLNGIGERFNDFGLNIDKEALKKIGNIRNNVEHYFSTEKNDSMRLLIAAAFPVAYELFLQAGEEPHQVLGDAWETMLEERTIYDKEQNECSKTFYKIDWVSDILSTVHLVCPECQSDLVAQKDSGNTNKQEIDAECRSCEVTISAERLIQNMAIHLDSGDGTLRTCPECSLATYIMNDDGKDEIGCVWCECKLGNCKSCDSKLTPDYVGERNDLCFYCEYNLEGD